MQTEKHLETTNKTERAQAKEINKQTIMLHGCSNDYEIVHRQMGKWDGIATMTLLLLPTLAFVHPCRCHFFTLFRLDLDGLAFLAAARFSFLYLNSSSLAFKWNCKWTRSKQPVKSSNAIKCTLPNDTVCSHKFAPSNMRASREYFDNCDLFTSYFIWQRKFVKMY